MKTLPVKGLANPKEVSLGNPFPFVDLMNSPAYFGDDPEVPKCDHIIL